MGADRLEISCKGETSHMAYGPGAGRPYLEVYISGFHMGGRSCPENFCICGEAMRAGKRA